MEAIILDNKLIITLDELEARVLPRSLKVLKPLLIQYIYLMTRLIMIIASLKKEKARELADQVKQGRELGQVMSDMGISVENLMVKDLKFPTDEEVDEVFGWLED